MNFIMIKMGKVFYKDVWDSPLVFCRLKGSKWASVRWFEDLISLMLWTRGISRRRHNS
jgi:hypothetical protein